MNPNTTLRNATVQDIQLELIRRTRFNTFKGERVCEILQKYRTHWRAVIFDQLGATLRDHSIMLPVNGLIKLRDLDCNIWNVDTLYVFTHTVAQAHELAAVFEEDDTGGMPRVHENGDATDMALGLMGREYGLLTVWWD